MQVADAAPPASAMDVDTKRDEGTDGTNIMKYSAKSGDMFDFDISKPACEKWGFYAGSRVMTPKGLATVIGIHDKFLWFHVDGDKGASYWDNYKTYDELIHNGFYLYVPPEPEPEMKRGEYKVKRIDYNNKGVHIILQNENGPCPLIALANILALRRLIDLEPSKFQRISVEEVVKKITNFMLEQCTEPNQRKAVEELAKLLNELQVGMDVNFGFTSCDSFEPPKQAKLFEFCNIRILHGWLCESATKEAQIIGNLTYNDLMLKLVTLQEDKNTVPTSSSNSNSNSNNANSNNSNSNTNSDKKQDEKPERKFTEEEGAIVSDFLAFTCSQLTEYGLQRLQDDLAEDELVVFFRNNHFTTLTKHHGMLYNLVTDIGYERERNVVWDLMKSVQEDSCLCSSEFIELNDAKRDELINTAILCGFSRDQAEEGLKAIHKPGQEYSTDTLITYLTSKFQPMSSSFN